MINSPEPSVALSDEQTKQLQVFYTRLTNLQTESSIATKNLENLKQEAIKVSMERQYTENVVETLKEQLATLKEQANEHLAMIDKSQIELKAHREERTKVDAAHNEKRASLDEREKKVEGAEKLCETLRDELNHNSKVLSEERLAVDSAKDAFQKATESVVWR